MAFLQKLRLCLPVGSSDLSSFRLMIPLARSACALRSMIWHSVLMDISEEWESGKTYLPQISSK